MTPRTSTSLKTYQRENNLPQTGDLDPATADKLGITRATPLRPRAERLARRKASLALRGGASASDHCDGGQTSSSQTCFRRPPTASLTARCTYLINTQANTGGWRWFGEQVANGDTLEVYARAVRPTGIVTQAMTRGKIELNVKDGVDLVRRVVVHGAAGDITIPLGSTSRPAAAEQQPGERAAIFAREQHSAAGRATLIRLQAPDRTCDRRGRRLRSIRGTESLKLNCYSRLKALPTPRGSTTI